MIESLPQTLDDIDPTPRASPPTVGVVLAAEEQPFPAGFATGPAPLQATVAGIPVVERTVRMLLAEGLERVVVVMGHASASLAEAARRAAPEDAPERVEVVRGESGSVGDGALLASAAPAVAGEQLFVVVRGDVVFTAGALSDLLRSSGPAMLAVDAGGGTGGGGDLGAFVFGPEIFGYQREAQMEGDHSLSGALRRMAAGERLATVALSPGTSCRKVTSPADARAARRMLRRSLGKASDGPVSRYLNRPLSTRLTMLLSPLRIPPGLITAVAGMLGLVAAAGLAWGQGLLSGLLIQTTNVVDGVDGETSRLHFRSSPRGAAIDALVDRVVDGSLVAGVALWLWPFHPSFEFKVAILTGTAYGWGFLALLFQRRLGGFEVTGPDRSLVMLLGGRDSRLLILAVGTALYHPGAAVVVGWAIYLSSVARRLVIVRRARAHDGDGGSQPAPPAPPDPIGEDSQRDLEEEGEQPEDQDGSHGLVARGAGHGQRADVPELHDADVAGDDGHGGGEADEGEHGQGLRPADGRVGNSHES